MSSKTKTRSQVGKKSRNSRTHKKNNYKWKIGDIVKIPGVKIFYIIRDEISSDTWYMMQYPERRYGDAIPKKVENIKGHGAWTKKK